MKWSFLARPLQRIRDLARATGAITMNLSPSAGCREIDDRQPGVAALDDADSRSTDRQSRKRRSRRVDADRMRRPEVQPMIIVGSVPFTK
jgi:hypothetical protein